MCPVGKFSAGSGDKRNFNPEELHQIQEIFDALVAECGVSPESEDGADMASAVLRLYGSGQRDPALVKAMLAPAFTRRRRSPKPAKRMRKRRLQWES